MTQLQKFQNLYQLGVMYDKMTKNGYKGLQLIFFVKKKKTLGNWCEGIGSETTSLVKGRGD